MATNAELTRDLLQIDFSDNRLKELYKSANNWFGDNCTQQLDNFAKIYALMNDWIQVRGQERNEILSLVDAPTEVGAMVSFSMELGFILGYIKGTHEQESRINKLLEVFNVPTVQADQIPMAQNEAEPPAETDT